MKKLTQLNYQLDVQLKMEKDRTKTKIIQITPYLVKTKLEAPIQAFTMTQQKTTAHLQSIYLYSIK